MAKERKEKIINEEINARHNEAIEFRAKPVPKATYVSRPIVDGNGPATNASLTQPKPPPLSSGNRAQQRQMYDQQADTLRTQQQQESELQRQQRIEMEEEDLRQQRSSFADEGGFCFKAKEIKIEYQ